MHARYMTKQDGTADVPAEVSDEEGRGMHLLEEMVQEVREMVQEVRGEEMQEVRMEEMVQEVKEEMVQEVRDGGRWRRWR